MAGKVKFDRDATFKQIIGADREPEPHELVEKGEAGEQEQKQPAGKQDRVQRSYFLDRDVDKALRRMALEEGKKLTEIVNELLRDGLSKYLIG